METELQPEYHDFQDKLRKLFNLKGDINITFTDADNDVVVVSDKYDLEYMISNSNEENPLKVKVYGQKDDRKKEEIKKEVKESKIEENPKQ